MKPSQSSTWHLDACKGCGTVGLVEAGEYPLCGRCTPNAAAIHLAENTIKRVQERAHGK